MKKLNLNSMIKVKLTPFGSDIFYHQYDELNEKVKNNGGRPIHPKMPRIDDKGFSEFQLHHFINLYGDYISIWQKNVIEDLSIYIDEKDLEECIDPKIDL